MKEKGMSKTIKAAVIVAALVVAVVGAYMLKGPEEGEEGAPQAEAVTLNTPTGTTENSTVLSWSQSTATDFASYAIYKSTSSGTLGDQIATITDATTTTLTITGLSPNTTYYFTVRVYNARNLYCDSDQVSMTTLGIEIQDNTYPYPLYDNTPMIYDLRASNDPQDYLGNEIADALPSDWKDYQPVIDKVNELTGGLTTDYSKTVAIANWVKQSKEYLSTGVSVANKFGGVIDIFNADNGVCLDASILTTAMLRLAGIPARSVYGGWAWHAFNEVYVDGKWIKVDATFGSGDAIIQEESTPSILDECYTSAENIYLPEWGVFADIVCLYKVKSVELPNISYGTVILPLTSKIIYYDSVTEELSFNKEKEDMNPVWVMPRLLENTSLPYLHYHVHANGEHYGGVPKVTGYSVFRLPIGKYKIHYAFSRIDLCANAYVDFEITSENEIIEILPADFEIASEANQSYFDMLVQAFENLPAYAELS